MMSPYLKFTSFSRCLQITCEFVGITKWRSAICGEYMQANHKVICWDL